MAVIVSTQFSAQGVAAATIMEGRAVTLTASGVREDLPSVTYASANQKHGVYIAFFPPDNFPRPTYEDWYSVPSTRVYDLNDASLYGDPTFYKKQYLVPRSMWAEPLVYSGELVALHNGRIGLTVNCFVDDANIRVPGNMIAVGTSGKLVYTNNNTHAIGIVERYAPDTGVLYISMGV
jgi:hypothetical protein